MSKQRVSNRTGIVLSISAVLLAGVAAGCGANTFQPNGNDGRKTKYDNVRVQVITLKPEEGGGRVLCITDFHQGQAMACDFSGVGNG